MTDIPLGMPDLQPYIERAQRPTPLLVGAIEIEPGTPETITANEQILTAEEVEERYKFLPFKGSLKTVIGAPDDALYFFDRGTEVPDPSDRFVVVSEATMDQARNKYEVGDTSDQIGGFMTFEAGNAKIFGTNTAENDFNAPASPDMSPSHFMAQFTKEGDITFTDLKSEQGTRILVPEAPEERKIHVVAKVTLPKEFAAQALSILTQHFTTGEDDGKSIFTLGSSGTDINALAAEYCMNPDQIEEEAPKARRSAKELLLGTALKAARKPSSSKSKK